MIDPASRGARAYVDFGTELVDRIKTR